MANKIKVGDYYLVSDRDQTIIDKAEVISITEQVFKNPNKGFFNLSNGLKVDLLTLEPLNSSMKVMVFDEEVWEGYKSRFEVRLLIDKLQDKFKLLRELKSFTHYKNKLNKLNVRLQAELEEQPEEEVKSLIKPRSKIKNK